MDTVLYLEPIIRQTPAPLRLGHVANIFFGEQWDADGENQGNPAAYLQLGSPLETVDLGSTQSHIPLVKTVSCSPDPDRDGGRLYTETLHYLKNKTHLIPYRSKVRCGLGTMHRSTHLPSLNWVRRDVVNLCETVCNPASQIVSDLVSHDHSLKAREHNTLYDWLEHDLAQNLARIPYCDVTFDSGEILNRIGRYKDQVQQTTSEYTSNSLRDIVKVLLPGEHLIPRNFRSVDPLSHRVLDYRHQLTPHGANFKSFGHIPIQRMPNIAYNPLGFQRVCDLFDTIPLTDFNVDVVVNVDAEILLYHEHLALNRFSHFADVDAGIYSGESVLRYYLDEPTLHGILKLFVKCHPDLSDDAQHYLEYKAVKMKLIKTMSDEAAIIVYRADAHGPEAVLGGVYFDIALQSLAPTSIIPDIFIDE